MKFLMTAAFVFALPLASALACEGDCNFIQPSKDLQSIVNGSAPKVDKGQAAVNDNCAGPGCAKPNAPTPFSLLTADVAGASPKKVKKKPAH
jgi:hypothetical protein